MSETPEQRARREIDTDLKTGGWIVQNRDDLDLTARRGIAAREFAMKSGFGFADYLLYLDRRSLARWKQRPKTNPRLFARTSRSWRFMIHSTNAIFRSELRIIVKPPGSRPVKTAILGEAYIKRGSKAGKPDRFACLIGENGKVLLTFFYR